MSTDSSALMLGDSLLENLIMQTKDSLYPVSLDKTTIKQSLSELIQPLVPKNCRRYHYRFCELLPQTNAWGFQIDPQPFKGKVTLIHNDFILIQEEGSKNKFVIVDRAYLDNLPELGAKVEVIPYARRHFNGQRIDEPEKEVRTLADGTAYTVTKMLLGGTTTELPLPVPKEQIQCPELLALVEQLEQLPAPDGFRCISHLLVDAGAKDFTLNDPKASDIKKSPPSISFRVANAKFIGEVTIGYDRGADTYFIQIRPTKLISPADCVAMEDSSLAKTTANESMEITDVYFDELGLRLAELIDDGAWQVIKVKSL